MYNNRMMSREKEIEGRSLEECRDILYSRYGKNYEIKDWEKTLKGGFLGLFNRIVVRVRYIVDERLEPSAQQGQTGRLEKKGYPTQQVPSSRYAEGTSYYPRGSIAPSRASASLDAENSAAAFTASRDRFLENQITKGGITPTSILQVANIAKQLEGINKKIDTMAQAASGNEEHQNITRIGDALLQNEFTPAYIKDIKVRMRKELSVEELDDYEALQTRVVDWIASDVHIAPKYSEKTKARSCHVIVIVGPTGVGKTTTVAKMAAKIKMAAKDKSYTPRVLLISIDTMKVGAVVQLEHWGDAMGLEVRKAMTAEDLRDLYDSYKNKMDYIFIDTSGYSHYDLENIAKIHTILAVDGMKSDVYLAVAAGTKARDLEGIVRNYESFDFRSIIVTKCDETSTYGNVISVLKDKAKSVSLITDGQKVLNFIKRAHPYYFLRSLAGFQVDKKHLIDTFGELEDAGE